MGAGGRARGRGGGSLPSLSWEPEPRRPTANTSQRIWRPGWPNVTSRWFPAAPTASTARLTARRWTGEGLTVAVLAGGLDIPYPSRAFGAAASHWSARAGVHRVPAGRPPSPSWFLTRNRLARCGHPRRHGCGGSGPAQWRGEYRGVGARLGRVVAAVPGPVTSSASAGCHALLRNGAELVTRAEDIVELVGHIGELRAGGTASPARRSTGSVRPSAWCMKRCRGAATRQDRRDSGRLRAGGGAGAGTAGDAGAGRAG